MYISYDYYRIFYYAAKYQSFTQAARVLMSEQPNVTRTIKQLETQLGCTLFVRSNRGAQLTPEGEELYTHIRAAVEQIQAGEEKLLLRKGLQSGVVSIGATEIALRCFLLPVLKAYQKRFPGVKLRVFNHSTYQAIATLKSGLVDVAIVTTPTGDLSTLKAREVMKIEEVAVCGTAFAGLAGKILSLETLTAYPLISLGPQTRTYEFYTQWFSQHGLEFAPDIEASTVDQILPMVKNDLGIGFVPRAFLAGEDTAHVIALHLEEAVPCRSICAIQRAGQPLSIAARELERMILSQRDE